MAEQDDIAALVSGDEVGASITVRGSDMTEALGKTLATPRLDNWQRSITPRLSEGLKFEASDVFEPKPQGEFSVRRTLKVMTA